MTTWVKNIVKNPQNSFWLQLSNAKFYPDFIIKLANGKTVVAEYKGGHLLTNDDSKEKELVGNLWALQSDDFEFLMLEKDNYREWLSRV